MSSRTLQLELPEPLFEQIEALAKLTQRSSSRLALDALQGYVALEAWQIQDIQTSLREAEAGEFASADEVAEVYRRYGA